MTELQFLSGLGRALPIGVRTEDDPVFSSQGNEGQRYAELFTGHQNRRILAPSESLAELMTEAARQALSDSGCGEKSVHSLLGYASVSEYVAPNELYAVHKNLKLADSTRVLPLADEFTSFIAGLEVARMHSRLSGASSLVVCGSRWSDNVDYGDAVSVSIGDGAGAAVVTPHRGPAERAFSIVDVGFLTASHLYGTMRMTPRANGEPSVQFGQGVNERPTFYMSEACRELFLEWGASAPAALGIRLLKKHGVEPREVSLIGHQATRLLLEHWQERIQPAATVDTLEVYGNMTLATLPVTLSARALELQTPYVLLLGLGLGIHTAACLLAVED